MVGIQTSSNPPVTLEWIGPLTLQDGQEGSFFSSPVSKLCGIYAFTIEFQGGFLVYFAGWTTRPYRQRIREHLREYRNGTYTIFDAKYLQKGERMEIWHGMWTKKSTNTPEKRNEFLARREEIIPYLETQLSIFRIFVAPLQAEKRVLARVEAAIMDILYSGPAPFSSLPDRGMALAPRWQKEEPLIVRNDGVAKLHGLPPSFEA